MIIHSQVTGMSALLQSSRGNKRLMMKIIKSRMILEEDRIGLSKENKIIARKSTSFKKI